MGRFRFAVQSENGVYKQEFPPVSGFHPNGSLRPTAPAGLPDAFNEMEKETIIMKKVFALVMAVLMVAAMFAGCGSSNSAAQTTAAAAAGNTVKIGMSGPLTGGASDIS